MVEASCGYMGGLCGGMAALVVGYPLDTIKVAQQSRYNSPSTWQTIRWIQANQGISGFYQGMTFPLLATGLMNSAFFGTYELCAKHLELFFAPNQAQRDEIERKMAYGLFPRSQFSNSSILIAGGIAGLTQVAIGCPVELVKIRMQTAMMQDAVQRPKPTGSLACMRQIFQGHGLRGLFKGSGIMFLREIPSNSVYMYTYIHGSELIKTTIKESKLVSERTNQKILGPFLGGGFAGLASWWLVLPMDVIKSRLQADCMTQPKYKGLIECAKSIKKKEGYSGFFRGFVPLTIRAFPINGAAFLAYEWFVGICRSVNQNQK